MSAAAEPDPLDIPPTGHVTDDALLGGRVRLLQPQEGYRVAIDPVFLAAAVPARAGERVLDVGAGTGAASLCLAARVPDCRISGLEIDPATVRLANENVRRNQFAASINVMIGDVARPPMRLAPGSFDHAMANPPYLEASRATAPPHEGRAGAHVEGRASSAADLAAWLRFALSMVRAKGTLTLIHRADRLDHVGTGRGDDDDVATSCAMAVHERDGLFVHHWIDHGVEGLVHDAAYQIGRAHV